MEKLQQFVNEHREWAVKTFGVTPVPAPIKHLKKEVGELLEAVEQNHSYDDVRMEFADCMILLLHAADKYGMSVDELYATMRAKFGINQSRKWPAPNVDGISEHIR